MKFSLIIPCYNEAKNIPLLLEACRELLQKENVEVILVDNGSSDESPRLLKELIPLYPGCTSVRVDLNKGYGYGIACGLRSATGDIIGWTHADMQTHPLDMLKGIQLFEQHGGNIFVKGRRYGRPIGDTIFTALMSVFETCLLMKPLWDINAQPTIFSKKFFQSWVDIPDDFSLDLFAYYEAKKQNIPIYRFPVNFGKRAYGVSHWNINWKAKWKFIVRTLQFSFQLKTRISK